MDDPQPADGRLTCRLDSAVTFFEGMVRVSASTSSTSGVWSNMAYVLWRWASGRPVSA